MIDFLRNFAVVSGVVAVGYVALALRYAVGAGEPSCSPCRVAQVFPIDAEQVKTAVAVVAEVKPLAACLAFLAFGTRSAWFAHISAAVGSFERQGKSRALLAAAVFLFLVLLRSGGFGGSPSFCSLRLAALLLAFVTVFTDCDCNLRQERGALAEQSAVIFDSCCLEQVACCHCRCGAVRRFALRVHVFEFDNDVDRVFIAEGAEEAR